MIVAGVDYSTRFVDVVLVDENNHTDWHRYELHGHDGFDRTRAVRNAMPSRTAELWDNVIAIGIEEPRGHGNGALLRVQGAILACLPVATLVQPLIPQHWRQAVGLPGNASKEMVAVWVGTHPRSPVATVSWPQDACDAYCIALAVRSRLKLEAA